jgi:hypothetical protein
VDDGVLIVAVSDAVHLVLEEPYVGLIQNAV